MNSILEPKSALRTVRFGPFEADIEAGELRKRGLKLKLEGKPFQILAVLLERAGGVVTRQELRERLWSPDTYVVFDRNLNTAVNKLRQALGDSAETPRFVETLPRRGYRFIAPVGVPGATRADPSESVHSIAVLPFLNPARDPSMEYLADGITESLIGALSRLPGVRVMARSTVFRYQGREVDPQTVGRELKIEAVLTGRVAEQGETLTVCAELVDVGTGWRLWGQQYSRKPSAIFAVEEEISRDISTELRLRLTGEEKQRLAKRCTDNAEAYWEYLRGRYHWNKMTEEGLRKAIAHFEEAIRKDRRYALAYAGLSDCYGLFAHFNLLPPAEVMPRAKETALQALDLDEGLAEAHASLAGVLNVFEWDWHATEREYRRALELNPNYATAHRWYAATSWRWGGGRKPGGRSSGRRNSTRSRSPSAWRSAGTITSPGATTGRSSSRARPWRWKPVSWLLATRWHWVTSRPASTRKRSPPSSGRETAREGTRLRSPASPTPWRWPVASARPGRFWRK